MSQSLRGVKRLRPDVSMSLRSASLIASLSQAVDELMANAIDAGATSVEVDLFPRDTTVIVADNGRGMTMRDLRLVGSPSVTSKASEDGAHGRSLGFRGEALASLAVLGLLEITARDPEDGKTWTRVVQVPGVDELVRAGAGRPAGCRVAARQLFSRLPVRRLGASSSAEVALVLKSLERFALASPFVAWSLRVDGTHRAALPPSRSRREAAGRVLGSDLASRLRAVRARSIDGAFEVRALVGMARAGSAAVITAVNCRPCPRTPEFAAAVRRVTDSYVERAPGGGVVLAPGPRGRQPAFKVPDGDVGARRESKEVDQALGDECSRIAALIEVECHPSRYDVLFDPTKSILLFDDWPAVLRTLEAALDAYFLGLCGGPREDESAFTATAVALVGEPVQPPVGRTPPMPARPSPSSFPLQLATGSASCTPRARAREILASRVARGRGPVAGGVGRRGFASRIGKALLPPRRATPPEAEAPGRVLSGSHPLDGALASRPAQSFTGTPLSATSCSGLSSPLPPTPRLPHLPRRPQSRSLFAWLPPEGVLAKGDGAPGLEPIRWSCATAMSSSGSHAGPLAAAVDGVPVTRSMLAHARYLGQLDRKFLLAESGGLLLCVDQHAADERVRVEALDRSVLGRTSRFRLPGDDEAGSSDGRRVDRVVSLSAAPGVETANLLPPRVCPVSAEDGRLLLAAEAELRRWGWAFRTLPGGSATPTAVAMTSAPRVLGVVLSRVLDLVTFAHKLRSAKGGIPRPEAITRVIDRKACRGAVMFGDSLDPTAGAAILRDLSRTRLPFQCAHGRPSFLPLARIG